MHVKAAAKEVGVVPPAGRNPVKPPLRGVLSQMPYWAPLRLTDDDRNPIGPGWPILHALVWAVLIAVVAIALWRRRVAVRGSTPRRRGSVLTAW